MYHYLTGAASWYMMTMITQVFGVRGEAGDLLLQPKLTAAQFDAEGSASVHVTFAGRRLEIRCQNPGRLEYGQYRVQKVLCGDAELCAGSCDSVIIPRRVIEALPAEQKQVFTVYLG